MFFVFSFLLVKVKLSFKYPSLHISWLHCKNISHIHTEIRGSPVQVVLSSFGPGLFSTKGNLASDNDVLDNSVWDQFGKVLSCFNATLPVCTKPSR